VALTPGSRIGSYEVAGQLGVGGMGEVYRATDTRLARQVAIKVLPEAVAADAERLARFDREAKTLAALNHPNIAAIYGLEDVDGSKALVMELVEGPTLDDRIAEGAIPVEEALAIAKQIAEALEAAHEQGIVHRDLKPANVKLRPDGVVKVLDFGLAKAMEPAGTASTSQSMSPTITTPAMTQAGMILGTAAYMSPEQAKGRAADRRSDVWAFGAVLFEVLTGRRLFGREDISETLAAVLTHTPDFDALPASVPLSVRRLLERCLARDRRQRLDSMAAVRLDLDDTAAPSEAAAEPLARSRLTSWMAAALLVGVIGGTTATLLWLNTRAIADGEVVVAQIAAPRTTIAAFHDGFAFSPDGRTLAFAGRDADGVSRIWLQRVDRAAAAEPLQGTEGAHHPFWSPDGAQLAFFAEGDLRRLPSAGGPVQVIGSAPGLFRQGSWGVEGTIVFSTRDGTDSAIFTVPSSGGTPARVPVEPAGDRPQWLPDGRRFLYSSANAASPGLYATTPEGESQFVGTLQADVGEQGLPFYYSPDGYILTNQGSALTVQRFDADALAPSSPPVVLAGRAGTPKYWFSATVAGPSLVALVESPEGVSGDPGDPVSRLRWVDRAGTQLGDLGEPGRYWSVRLSPDGGRAVVNEDNDVWMVRGNGRERLTSGVQTHYPVWSATGTEFLHSTARGIWRRRLDTSGEGELLPMTEGSNPTDWSGDLVLMRRTSVGDVPSDDIWLYDLSTQTASSWLSTPFNEAHARFSPDGRYVAFTSDRGGSRNVYVRSTRGEGNSTAVSFAGGEHPVWRRDGKELFYLGARDEIMSVEVTGDGTMFGDPRELFRVPLNDITRFALAPYDVAPDGQQFLLNVTEPPTPLLFIHGIGALIDREEGTAAR